MISEAVIIELDKSEVQLEWDDNRFVWDLSELENFNRYKRKNDNIEIVKKHDFDANLGIRAHPNMTVGKCLASIFMPGCNEFIFILLYLGFAIYFWVQTGFIAFHDSSYGFKMDDSYNFMLIATLTIAICISTTLVYVLFYSLSLKMEQILRDVN